MPPPRSASPPRGKSPYRPARRPRTDGTDEPRRRGIRRGPLIAAIVLIVIALILYGISAAVNQPTTVSVKPGQAWQLSPQTLNSVTVSVQYQTSTGSGHTYLMTGQPTCIRPAGVVVNASGGKGTFSAVVQPGKTYNVYSCGASGYIAANYTASLSGGFGWFDLLATILLVIGILFLILAFIPRRHDPFEI